jgi:membrane protein
VPDRALPWNLAHDNVRCHGRWVSPGAGVATVLWIVASTVYVAKFNSCDKTCGSLGGVVILLTWLYLSALMVLLGAVTNVQAERQTHKDSTPRAMGQRDAWAVRDGARPSPSSP